MRNGHLDEDLGAGDLGAEAKADRATPLTAVAVARVEIRRPGISDCAQDVGSSGSRSRRSLVDHVIDEIAVFGRHEFADAFDILGTTDCREKGQILKRAQYCISHRERRGRITGTQILGNLCKVARRTRGVPQLHRS